jgi:voltage-gated potassium channel Kch
MLLNIFIGLIMVAITVTIQALGSRYWLETMANDFFNLTYDKFKKRIFKFLITTAFLLLLMNYLQAFLWALLYYSLPGITVLKTLEESVYFSLVTFTTLGYGDITIGTDHRMLSGVEAINGVLLIGWSTALMFSAMQEIWKRRFKNEIKN